MSQVLSVSATTAAFAMEALKPSRRISTKDQVQDAKNDAERNEERLRGGSAEQAASLIPASSLSLDLAFQQGQHPLIPRKDVEDAYLENNGEG